jgi:hypothetical protein
MQIIKEMMICDISLNDEEPRLWSWKFPHLRDMDTYDDDRFLCTEARCPYSKIMYYESIRKKHFHKAVQRVEQNDWEEVAQFRPIIIDEYGMLISGLQILQIHKSAGMKSVEVAQVYGMELVDKIEMMMEDTCNFGQFNWTPKLPRMRHKKVENYADN